MEYFSSDFHLGHTNVIRYDNRPFLNIHLMNETILSNLEALLKKGDKLFYLGDFCLSGMKNANEFLSRISNTQADLFFIRGNHDSREIRILYDKYGSYLGEQKTISVQKQAIVLNHYRMDVWDRSHYGSWHLHGHSHHGLPERKDKYIIDVGCNGWDYKPLSFTQISDLMGKKEYIKQHHHGDKSSSDNI